MELAKLLPRSIKALQFATLITFCLVVVSGMLVLWVWPDRLDVFLKVLGALGPYVFPMIAAAFLGSHVKEWVQAQAEAIKMAAESKKNNNTQGLVG